MDKGENGLSNLLANRMPSLNSLSSNLQQLGSGLVNNGANNLNNAALMNAFNFAGLGIWDNQLVSAMSQYLDINNSLLNLKQDSSPTTTDNSQTQQQTLKRTDDDDNLENGCNRDVLDLKINNNKRFKVSNNGCVQQHNNETIQLNHNKTSKDQLNFLDNGRSFPCHECHKTFATEVDLKMHLLRHVMQHPFSCSTCGKGFKYEHTLQFHEKQHGADLNNKLNLKNSTKKSSNNGLNPTTPQLQPQPAPQQQPNNHQRTDLLDEKSLFGNGSSNRKNKYPSSSTTSKQQLLHHHLNDDEEDNIPNNLLAVASNPLTTKLTNNNNNNNNNNLTSKCTPSNSSLFSSLSNSSSSAFDLGLSNSSIPNLGIQMKSEKVLIVMVEGVNPVNDQTFTLYKCNICGFAFANLAPVTEHILTLHSNNQKFNCDKCGANFKRRNELILHDQIHKAMEQQANSKLIMMQYLNANDPNKLDNNNNDNLLLNSNNLNGAVAHLNGDADNLIGLNLIKTQRKDSESSQESLNLTTIKTAKNGQSKELRNDELDELSKNIAVVKENVTNDLGEIEEIVPGQFKCRYCDKTFDRVFSVHRHERVHTGFKPCVCKVCGKGFSEKRNLRHHLIRFHSDGSGRELLRRVRKDKSMNSEENNEAKRQLKAMEMNILSINNNSFQSNTGSDEDHDLSLINSFNSNSNNLKDKQTDHEDNSSNHSAETNSMNNKSSSSRRRKSVKPYKVNQPKNETTTVEHQQDTEEDEKDDNSSSDQTSFKEAMEDDDSNNDGSNNDEQLND